MSEPENFVARWSRLKRGSQGKAAPAADAVLDDASSSTATPQPPPAAFDPASLPSIESITAGTDIRAFLQSGVPAELTKAALRRVWTTDPAIRDFIGMAENQWDFTDPTAMPGFGPLEATDDVRKLVAQAMGRFGESVERDTAEAQIQGDPSVTSSVHHSTGPAAAEPPPAGTQGTGMPEGIPNCAEVETTLEKQDQVSVAAQHSATPEQIGTIPNRRPHGSALPK